MSRRRKKLDKKNVSSFPLTFYIFRNYPVIESTSTIFYLLSLRIWDVQKPSVDIHLLYCLNILFLSLLYRIDEREFFFSRRCRDKLFSMSSHFFTLLLFWQHYKTNGKKQKQIRKTTKFYELWKSVHLNKQSQQHQTAAAATTTTTISISLCCMAERRKRNERSSKREALKTWNTHITHIRITSSCMPPRLSVIR